MNGKWYTYLVYAEKKIRYHWRKQVSPKFSWSNSVIIKHLFIVFLSNVELIIKHVPIDYLYFIGYSIQICYLLIWCQNNARTFMHIIYYCSMTIMCLLARKLKQRSWNEIGNVCYVIFTLHWSILNNSHWNISTHLNYQYFT